MSSILQASTHTNNYVVFTVGGWFATGRPLTGGSFATFEAAREYADGCRGPRVGSCSVWGWREDPEDHPNAVPDELYSI